MSLSAFFRSTGVLGDPVRRVREPALRRSVLPTASADQEHAKRPWFAIACVLAAIAIGFSARCVWLAGAYAITCDESVHLVHCLNYWMTGDDLGMWELGAPRLPHALNALPAYLNLRWAGALPAGLEGKALVQALGGLVEAGPGSLLVPARLVAIAWGVLLLLLVFWSLARTGRPWLGLVAASLVAFTPEIVAHSSIAGSDMPFTTAAFAALLLIARYAEKPSVGRWLAMALAVGVAWAMRHTGLLLIATAGGVELALQLRRARGHGLVRRVEAIFVSFWLGIALSAIAFLVLWVGDGLGVVTIGEVADRVTMLRIPRHVGPLDVSGWPVPESLLSLLKQIRHQNAGHEAFFLGESGTMGWPLYFPIAFLLKTPIGLLALMIVAVVRLKPEGTWDMVVLAFLAILWVMLVRNKVNIGLRYALLTYPLIAIFVSRLFAPAMLRDRVWGPVSALAAAGFVAASIGCGTRCLSYFNEIGGGSRLGWLYLADSNVDWGQDFDALARTVRRLGLTEITTDVQPERRLALPGVLAIVNPGRALQVPTVTPLNRRLYDAEGGYIPIHTRYVAVSVTRLRGLYSQNDMSWLWTRRLVERVGDSLFLFDLDSPAEVPLYE